jgi:hypothetical protein
MSTPLKDTIKLTDIKNVFNQAGTNLNIKLSDYYSDSSTNYTAGISGIPLKGNIIKLSDFYNKSKITYITSINISSVSIYDGTTSTNTTGSIISVQPISLTNNGYYYFKHQGNNNAKTNSSYTDYTISITSTTNVNILLVGGGGGGGCSLGSGGGAGGLVYITNYTLTAGTYKLRIGGGGLGMTGVVDNSAINGTDTILFDMSNNALITALGGARGNGQSNAYNNGISSFSGGSGAGGVRWKNTPGAGIQTTNSSISAISRTYGFGFSGGNGSNVGAYGGGGGGGAGGVGTNADSGHGGNAKLINITGTDLYFAAGGGGSSYFGGYGLGGQGPTGTYLGGQGGAYGGGGNAVIDTGSGGGGGGVSSPGGYGSAGVAIINFEINTLPTGVYARYTGDGPFTKTGNNITQWNDISGLNRHITLYRGAPTQISVSKGLYGTVGTGSFNVVSGTINDGFKLPFALPQNNNLSVSSYTIAYIARYTGDINNITGNKRIFDSTATVGNHIWGFHDNTVGRSHNANYGWRTETFKKQSDPNYWLIGIETELNSRFNGIDWTITNTRSDGYKSPQKSTTTPTFSINFGAYSGDGTNVSECSNWQVAELIFYDRELTLSERISLENYLALKYSHMSFSNVVSSLSNYKLLTNNTGTYNNWYNVWNGQQYAYLNSIWVGPGKGQFVNIGNLGYFGILYTNGNRSTSGGYANRNQYYLTYNIKTLPNISKIHIIACGGGGGGGAGRGGGGGGGAGLSYIANTTNLSNTDFTFVVGNCGREGWIYNGQYPSCGGDSSISWTLNSVNYSMIAYGGYEGGNGNRTSGAGGLYTITNANSGGNVGGGNGGVGIYSAYICQGGAIYTPTNVTLSYTGVSTNLWTVAQAFGASSYNSGNWWGGNSSGNGGSGAGNDGTYDRNGSVGGWGWVLIIYDNNV